MEICPPVLEKKIFEGFLPYMGVAAISNLLKLIVNRFKRAGYSLDIMHQTACLVFNPIMVEGYVSLFIARRRFRPQTQ